MKYAWYPLLVALAAGWVFADARRRMTRRAWSVAVLAGGPLGLAAYFALRPLHQVSRARAGRRGSCFRSSSCWTGLLAVAALWNLAFAFVDLYTLALAWALGAVPALAVGMALKQSTLERGPTGLLAAMAGWYPGPERTPDGRAYICRECGKSIPSTCSSATAAAPGRVKAARRRAGYFTATKATSTSTSRGRRATCTVARPGGMPSLK